jgi:hypothetical protein
MSATLDVQTEEAMARFERQAVQELAVQQCWRVSPGPDFMLVLAVHDMEGYLEVAARLFNDRLGVRNVRTFFPSSGRSSIPDCPCLLTLRGEQALLAAPYPSRLHYYTDVQLGAGQRP